MLPAAFAGEAEPLYKRALAGREALGREHPDTLTSVSNFAALYFAQRDWPRAAQLWRRSTAAIADRVQRGARDTGLTGKKASEAQQLDWQFWGLVKAAYRLAPEGHMPDIASAGEMFQTAQWALSSEAAQSLVQMAARGTKGDAALAALVRERQDLADEWQRREQIQTVSLSKATAKRNAKAEAENRERMATIDKSIAEIDAQLKIKFPDYAALTSPAPLAVEASEDDDGYLSASEIAGLKLDADWVILSACNTAAGEASNAEALSGLARAFIYAHARALLVSHWAVDSNATVKLITTAMREMARDKRIGRAKALRRAMLALIDKGAVHEAHPAYWAPFIVVGEGAR